jgi:HD-GYP domain-containing protein (c-di-GMP phosphodiesterase class II)
MAESIDYKDLYLKTRRRNEELRIINTILSEVARSYDLGKLFHSTLGMILRHFQLSAGSIWILNDAREELILHTHRGCPSEYILKMGHLHYKRGMGLVGIAWKTGRPAVAEDLDTEEMKRLGYRSGLAVPLVYKHAIFGVMELLFKERRSFSSEDIDFLKTVGSQLAVALDYQRSYKECMFKETELACRLEEIKVMNEISRLVLSTSEVEGMEFFKQLLHLVKRIIPCDMATLQLMDREKRGFRILASWGGESYGKELIPMEETSLAHVVETGMVHSRPDLALERRLLSFDKEMLEMGFSSDISIPLSIAGKSVGALRLASYRVGGFTLNHLQIAEKFSEQLSVALSSLEAYKNVKDLFLNVTKALVSTIEEKDPFTKGHSERVSFLATELGKKLDLDHKHIHEVMLAALLHDIGKIGIPDKILNKPSHLTQMEHEAIKEHAKKGAKILEPIHQLRDILPLVLYHHEYYDGCGYPEGLKGTDIPLGARIIKICDAFDAMTSARPYRDARTVEFALEEIKRHSGEHFDPELTITFLTLVLKD